MFNFFNKGTLFFKISKGDRDIFCKNIIESSAPRGDFYFLVVLSTLIVSFGVALDNVILIIGGMLVTPLLSPIMAIALGVTILNFKVLFRSIKIFLIASLLAVGVSALIGYFLDLSLDEIKVIEKMKPNLLTFFIAMVAGIAASYTWVKPTLANTLPGIAITVTLIPPLSVIGLSLAKRDIFYLHNSIATLSLNALGIIISSIVIFFVLDFYKSKKTIVSEVSQEEKDLKN